MPLLGVGIDVVEVDRVARLLDHHATTFVRRWYTPAEIVWARQEGCEAMAFATVLAGKEAVWKSLGLDGERPVPWRSLEVLPDGAGGQVTLPIGMAPGATRFRVGFTHAEGVVMACALAWSGVVRETG